MSRGAKYVSSLIAGATGINAGSATRKSAAKALGLTRSQSLTLASALADDAQDHYYSACLSVVDAIRGLRQGFYTWATVKLYYSMFYSLRACLAVDKVCVFYVGKSPFSVLAAIGDSGNQGNGTTHEFVLELFARHNVGHKFCTQTVDGVPAIEWLQERRVECNYRVSRFCDPSAPIHFRHVEAYGIRRLVSTYVADVSDVYTFDKDHAMLALPLQAILLTGSLAKGLGTVKIDPTELSMLTNECCDDDGPLAHLTSVFREFAL